MKTQETKTKIQAALENAPVLASRQQCYRCGGRIGDAEYTVNDDGICAHHDCNEALNLCLERALDALVDLQRACPDESPILAPARAAYGALLEAWEVKREGGAR